MFMSKLSVNRSVICAARQIFIHRYFFHITQICFYHLVRCRYPDITNTMHQKHRYSNRTSNKPESSSSTWLHAKNFIILCLAVCLSSSIPFLIYFFFLFSPPFRKFVCNYNVSNIIIKTYETSVEQNQFVLKYVHIDFVP